MRVVFDTNILVLSQLGKPATDIMRAATKGTPSVTLAFFYSPAMLAEYRDALKQVCLDYPDTFYPDQVERLIAGIEGYGRLILPTVTLTTDDENACTHEPDNRFLECAIEAASTDQENYIVTVNEEHFPTTYQAERGLIEVVGPTQFSRILFGEDGGA